MIIRRDRHLSHFFRRCCVPPPSNACGTRRLGSDRDDDNFDRQLDDNFNRRIGRDRDDDRKWDQASNANKAPRTRASSDDISQQGISSASLPCRLCSSERRERRSGAARRMPLQHSCRHPRRQAYPARIAYRYQWHWREAARAGTSR